MPTALRLLFSILLSYPLSGAIYAIFGIVRLAFTEPSPFKNITGDILLLGFWILAVPSCAGFVPANEADSGPRIDMYPWIVPTAALLFFLFSRGWRWFRKR